VKVEAAHNLHQTGASASILFAAASEPRVSHEFGRQPVHAGIRSRRTSKHDENA